MIEETSFLDKIRCNPDDDVTRLVYADWLDEQGDDESVRKSKYIRLENRLPEVPIDSDEYADLQNLRRELAKKLKRTWLSAVSKVAIENCDAQFEFECPKQWDHLRPTKSRNRSPHLGVRHRTGQQWPFRSGIMGHFAHILASSGRYR